MDRVGDSCSAVGRGQGDLPSSAQGLEEGGQACGGWGGWRGALREPLPLDWAHPPHSPPPYRVPLPHQACSLLVTPAPSAHSLFSPPLDSRPSLAASWELIASWT